LDKTDYGKQPYIVYRHNDTAHPHVHVLTSRVNIQTQKKINDSHDFRKPKTITDKLETKYDLTIADPNHFYNNIITWCKNICFVFY